MINSTNLNNRHAAEFREDPSEERNYDDVPNGFFMPNDDHLLDQQTKKSNNLQKWFIDKTDTSEIQKPQKIENFLKRFICVFL